MNNDSVLMMHQFTMHEIRYDPEFSSPGDPTLLVTGYAVHDEEISYTADGANYTSGDLVSGTVWRWRPNAEPGHKLHGIVDLGDTITPKLTGLSNVGMGDMRVEVHCPDGPVWHGVDYMHQSSACAGVSGTIVSSLRNLNAVVSHRADGSGIEWIMTGDPSLNTSYNKFLFERENEKFYYPHHVTQLPTGNILLVDDGINRPSCLSGDEIECYTRAVEYALDEESGYAKLVWQFEYPYNFSKLDHFNSSSASASQMEMLDREQVEVADMSSRIGNSVVRLENGRYVVGFTTLSDQFGTYAEIFEVTAEGHLSSLMRVSNVSFFGDGSYRALPYESVYGETRECPLGNYTPAPTLTPTSAPTPMPLPTVPAPTVPAPTVPAPTAPAPTVPAPTSWPAPTPPTPPARPAPTAAGDAHSARCASHPSRCSDDGASSIR